MPSLAWNHTEFVQGGKGFAKRRVFYPRRSSEGFKKTMPHEIWETLTPHAQKLCEFVKAGKGVWPAGAGVMHPLANKRAEAAEASDSVL